MTDLPRVHVTTDDPLSLAVDALVVPVFKGAIEGPGTEDALQALGLSEVPRDGAFRGKLGETLDLAAPGLPCGRVTLVGLGRMDQLDDEQIRRAAGSATRASIGTAATVATTLPLTDVSVSAVRAAAEGAILGAYRYLEHRSDPPPTRLEDITLVVPTSLADPSVHAVEQATVHARAQCLARDLINTPAADQSPQAFCDRVGGLVGASVTAEVWDEARLAGERCGGLLAVGRGSSRPPRLLHLRYTPAEPIATVVLVGKGVVFDSGGLSLKRPYPVMAAMKNDMAGAAVVAAVLSALAELELPVEVVGLCALAENMPSGEAQRPSDVIRIRNGTTVEVRNTDAEGRLVLADALVFATELDPDAIVDVATLTGAVKHAVGARATGAFGNDDDLLRQILSAAEAAGEPTWHLPLWADLRDNLESEVADLDNLGVGDQAGATMAGLFLREFVDGQPWVHLDIAGAAWADTARHHLPKEATGTAVRTLLRWLELTHA